MVGVCVLFWAMEDGHDIIGPERFAIVGCWKKVMKDCFSYGAPRLCATHEGELCPACLPVSVGCKAAAGAGAPQTLGFPVGVIYLLPVLSSTPPCLAPLAGSASQPVPLASTYVHAH